MESGEALGIVGPNGAGKTTWFNLVTGAVHADAGKVIFEGKDITRSPGTIVAAQGIGRTFQIPKPFSGMTVFENVLVGATHGRGMSERASYERCVEILEITGLHKKVNVLAGSLTLLDRKRLELARALATDPTLLLMDEIAGGLTEAEVEELIEEIKKLRETGITIVWIEHIVHALLAVVDRIVVIQFGRKLCEGDPHEVMNSAGSPGLLHGRDAGMSLLEIENASVYYEDFQALYDINIKIEEGEIFACIGANGAGKSTMLKTIAGVLAPAGAHPLRRPAHRPHASVQAGGTGHLLGARRPAGLPEPHRAREPPDRRLRNRKGPWTTDAVYELFPLLQPLKKRQASGLSGGEQQALAIGRALMANPRLILMDEVSLGLAPVVIKRIYEAFPILLNNGCTILVVEQDVQHVLTVATHVACFLEGRIALQGVPSELTSDQITAAYFGV